MARYTGPTTKLSRREGVNLYLKGDRCFTDKDSFERKPYPPGQHGQSRSKFSEYATQLREKQKIKRYYGLLERQFRKTYREASRRKGVTGENLIQLLEGRLDNMVYRAGFGRSRPESRIWVVHRHFEVNGKIVNVPSCQLKAGDVVVVREKSRKGTQMLAAVESSKRRGMPEWLEVDQGNFKFTVKMLPARSQITTPMNEQLVVELYSK